MILNALSSAWRPATVAAAALIAVALLMASPAAPVSAQGAPTEQTYIVRFRAEAVERPPKPGLGGTPGALVGPGGRELPRGAAVRLASLHGGRLGHVYEHALQGFSIRLSPQAAAALARDPSVLAIEPDGPVSINTDPPAQSPTPSWGLDRIDQRNLPLNNSFDASSDGAGVTAYIIDTGILASHAQFVGRVGAGYDSVDGGDPTDCNGHGTHVAGTVGGATYGVAKAVTIVPVRVLDCTGSGTWAGVIAGINWVTGNHVGGPAVANMSLGGGASASVDAAIEASIADGITYAVAAGNSSLDACNYSPARTPNALTVGATTSSDTRASYSNTGTCMDIFAPGSGITSAWYTGTSATAVLNGTSMASPHVAGAAALYLASNTSASPATVGSALKAAGTAGVVSSAGTGSPNLLLYVGAPPVPPTFGTITGTVTAQVGGAAIAGAAVNAGSGLTTTTNVSGDYTISNVPTGSRTVTASAAGFVTSSANVNVVANPTSTPQNFALAAVPACAATVTNDTDSNNSGGGTVTITWTNSPGVTRVRVERQSFSGSWSLRDTWTSGATTTSESDSSSDPMWRLVPRCGGVDYPGTPFDPAS